MDVYITESRINNFHLNSDSAHKLFNELEKKIFARHGVSDSVYYESYRYYLDDLKAMDEIYGAIVDSLSLRERMVKEPRIKEPEKPSENNAKVDQEVKTDSVSGN